MQVGQIGDAIEHREKLIAQKGLDNLTCAVIIVSFNSERTLSACLRSLLEQSCPPRQIILIDSGSDHPEALAGIEPYLTVFGFTFERSTANIGFCAANNRGLSHLLPGIRYVLFLNPDALVTASFIEKAAAWMQRKEMAHVGALSPLLLGYDFERGKPTGLIDSAGIGRKWYGRWYDRFQGQKIAAISLQEPEEVAALCGALMFCRFEALQHILLQPGVLMDPLFFMYKEDIDLSLRLRSKGWSLYLLPHLEAYHGRGWKKDRSKMQRRLRLLSARNELRLHVRMRSACLFYSLFKYLAVLLLDF